MAVATTTTTKCVRAFVVAQEEKKTAGLIETDAGIANGREGQEERKEGTRKACPPTFFFKEEGGGVWAVLLSIKAWLGSPVALCQLWNWSGLGGVCVTH